MAKFKVDDWVEMLLPPDMDEKDYGKIRVHILEVCAQTCEAGIEQTTYTGRVWTEKPKLAFVLNQSQIREMELGEKIDK